MQAVAKTREALERLLSIMKYEDKEFYIYRVRDVYVDMEPNTLEYKGGKLWTMKLSGDVAWSATPWVRGVPNPDEKSETGAGYTNLAELCKKLDIGVEVWTSEPGMCFQEYILIDNSGKVKYDTEEWTLEYDDDMNPIEEGGFEEYGEWSFPEEIYKEG